MFSQLKGSPWGGFNNHVRALTALCAHPNKSRHKVWVFTSCSFYFVAPRSKWVCLFVFILCCASFSVHASYVLRVLMQHVIVCHHITTTLDVAPSSFVRHGVTHVGMLLCWILLPLHHPFFGWCNGIVVPRNIFQMCQVVCWYYLRYVVVPYWLAP